jgi:uncharacterized protein DUF1360
MSTPRTRGRRTRTDGTNEDAGTRRNGPKGGQTQQSDSLRDQMPVADYAMLVTIFNGLLATGLLAHRCSKEPLPKRVEPKDIALFAIATQKLSRAITKEKVTTAFRAPFTEVEGKGGAGELEERPKGRGLRRAVGELLTCPFCLGTWIASGFIYGYIFSPRVTRTVASIFAVSGIADFLQQLYIKAQEMNDQT